MKTIATLVLFAVSLTASANPITPGFMEVAIDQNAIAPDQTGRRSDISLFLLKDFRWEIGNCLRLWHRNEGENQNPGATVDTFVPLDWHLFGFGIEFADADQNSIISLSNSSTWNIGELDASGAYRVTCNDPRFGILSFIVSSQANGVPESCSMLGFAALAGMFFFATHRLVNRTRSSKNHPANSR